MNRECSLELYFFFGATLVLLFRLPTILWGLCDGGRFETPTQPLRSNRRRREALSTIYFVRPPTQSSVYPAPPQLPPPPAYQFENDGTSMDSTKLPTYDQAIQLSNAT
uniref:Uncharacterized protein n=1 Tax=Panagrolaimus sp. ES5 TaxID=591445 RepID=A0AC34GW25_9BILA